MQEQKQIRVRAKFERFYTPGVAETVYFVDNFENAEKRFYEIFGKKKYKFLSANRLPVAVNSKTI